MRPVYVDTLSAVTVNRPVLVSFLVIVFFSSIFRLIFGFIHAVDLKMPTISVIDFVKVPG